MNNAKKMSIQARPYRDSSDFTPMRRLLVAGLQSGIPASYMHPGVLDFAMHFPPDEEANRRDILLWMEDVEDEPQLAAWAYHFRHEGTFDFFISPALYDSPQHALLIDEYVLWAEGRARAAGLHQVQTFWALEQDGAMQRLLLAHGFAQVSLEPPPPLFGRPLDDLPNVALPAGFSVQDVGSPDDGRLRAAVTNAAFRPDVDWESYWGEYAQFIGSAVYDGRRDLFVRAPDGRGASACTIWFDAVNGVGLFEPVATHPQFQRMGLGKAVMAEGLRRMKDAGMGSAVIGFDPTNVAARALYTSLGFGPVCFFAVYSKGVA